MKNLVLNYLENSSRNYSDKIAFIDEHNSITFKETKYLALNISEQIINKVGYQKNNPILIFLPKSVNAIISMLGTVYSGNFYTPTDINFPDEKIKTIVSTLDPIVIITDSNHINKLLEIGINEDSCICYDKINFKQDTATLKSNEQNAIDMDLVYTYFTSGSTGIPKGVTINHRNIIDYIDWACQKFSIDQETIFGNQSALYFDISTQDIYATLKAGATMVIIPERFFSFPIKAVEFIKEKNINFLYWVPSAYINLANFKALDSIIFDKVKSIMFGGEVMPIKHLNYLRDKLPNLKFIANVYGPTEATVNITYYIIEKDFSENENLPLGYPIENKKVFLLNDNNEIVIKKNVKAELCVSGSSLSSGYYKNPLKTNEVFVQNPLHNDYKDIIYKTGDLAMYDEEGLLIFCGRKDNQIKHLGYRIELGEIETATLSLKDISNCITFYDENKRKITLLYTSKNEKLEDRHIRVALSGTLPKYMIPTQYHKLNQFPINANGKIDRVLLKNKYIDK